ncbi:MAG TPA: bifunctional DNA-formamidopyrimidine glycosylase/DNA-(apurinic or apyrimidinic site) lyase [Polyangiales bacterium]|jgi:formamidopyrimidine-DNA glycosylase|nr:bifunctional DNA-formamidopyrimidine glycosylase/DNA-(apurinic or apyrimidinic site) lyase [Polyangiales bacterium]
MPELPEVEHTRRNLERWWKGARLARVHAHDARIVRPLTARNFERRLNGATVERIERRGKWIRVVLDRDALLFVHLGMTGWFEPTTRTAEPLRFERIAFDIDRKRAPTRVSFVDPRRWGQLSLVREDTPTWSALGPDPLSDGIDPAALHARLQRSKNRSIKEALLDQTVLAGVGNIQAIEALWKARIDPRSPARALRVSDVRALVKALHWTIERTLRDLARGDHGARNPFRIYGRKGEPCPRCGTALSRIELAGRTTMFCTGCQVALRIQ